MPLKLSEMLTIATELEYLNKSSFSVFTARPVSINVSPLNL